MLFLLMCTLEIMRDIFMLKESEIQLKYNDETYGFIDKI